MNQANLEEKQVMSSQVKDVMAQNKEKFHANEQRVEEKQEVSNYLQPQAFQNGKKSQIKDQKSKQKDANTIDVFKSLKQKIENNNFQMACIVNDDSFSKISNKEQSELEKFCLFEPLLIKGKKFREDHNIESLSELLKYQEFQTLKQYSKFNKYSRNERYRVKNKDKSISEISGNIKEDQDIPENDSDTQQVRFSQAKIKRFELTIDEPMIQLKSNQTEVVDLRNKDIQLLKWKETINKCKSLQYRERTLVLMDHYNRDHPSFIDQLVRCAYETPVQDFFSSLIMISKAISNDDQYSELIIHACAFYNLEGLNQKEKDVFISKVHHIIQRLSKVEKPMMVYGFMKLLYMNEISLSEENSIILNQYINAQSHTWEVFIEFLVEKPIELRKEILNFVPRTGFFFTGSFILSLKEKEGGVYSDLPMFIRQRIIEICIYSSTINIDILKHFIKEIGELTLKHDTLLIKSDFQDLLKLTVQTLRERSPLWVNKLQKLQAKLTESVERLVERRIKSFMEIKDFLIGDDHMLNNTFQQTRILEEENHDEQQQLIEVFHKLNQQNKDLHAFQMIHQDSTVIRLIQQIESKMDRKFHYVQKMCLYYILENQSQRFQIINFGIGTGKSLICTALAILLRLNHDTQVVILNTSKYLTFRDYQKYLNLIKKFKITCVINQFYSKAICFWDERYFLSELKQLNYSQKHQNTIFIVDEYDQLMINKKTVEQNFKAIKCLREMQQLIGFSGSTFSDLEKQILKTAFNTTEVKFPSIRQTIFNQVHRAEDQIFIDQNEWKENLVDIVNTNRIKVPCLVVLSSEDIKLVKTLFKKHKFVYLDSYISDNNYVELQHIIDQQFIDKLKDDCYGVYFMSEQLGRGTDFPSNHEIEDNGGIFLLIGSIFDSTTVEQIQGRVGRLQNKGQIQSCIWNNNSNVVNNFIRNQTTLLDQNIVILQDKLLVKMNNEMWPILQNQNLFQHSSSEDVNDTIRDDSNIEDEKIISQKDQSLNHKGQTYSQIGQDEVKDDKLDLLNQKITVNISQSIGQAQQKLLYFNEQSNVISAQSQIVFDKKDLQTPGQQIVIQVVEDIQAQIKTLDGNEDKKVSSLSVGKKRTSQTDIDDLLDEVIGNRKVSVSANTVTKLNL